ncbi:MAG: ABC transporter permease [Rhodobacteraceae bacterium]|nr:ABC transporter permease [Paracoccaceae bacterium]
MGRYLLGRLLQFIPLILFVVVLNFTLVNLAPGDPARVLAGEDAPLEYIETLRQRFGLDEPFHVRLYLYLKSFVQLDFGYSYAFDRPVLALIGQHLANTLLLVIPAKLVAVSLGMFIGAWTSGRFGSFLDTFWSTVMLLLYAAPTFWVGLMIIMVFSIWLGWFPTSGIMTVASTYSGWEVVVDRLRHLFLPSLTLMLSLLPIYARITRAAMLEVQHEDYILTARAKGLTEREVLFGHALPNALLPPITIAGISFGLVFTGALLVEIVYSWPGLGRLMYQSVYRRDYPLLMGIFTISAVAVAVFSLLTDLVYMLLDPRVKLHRREQ